MGEMTNLHLRYLAGTNPTIVEDCDLLLLLLGFS